MRLKSSEVRAVPRSEGNCFGGRRAAAAWLLTAAAVVAVSSISSVMLVEAQTSFAQAGVNNASQAQQVELIDSYPYYMQSPLVNSQEQQQQQPELLVKQQRATIPTGPEVVTSPSAGQTNGAGQSAQVRLNPVVMAQLQPQPQAQIQLQQQQLQSRAPECLYDKRYFLKLDQCLERKPYPTVGMPAFKNDDLLIKKGLSDKYGCLFILTNGLFKNYIISKYALDSDTQCLDQDKTSQLSVQFSNVTLYYLWQLRCLNYADQLLDDATLGGRTLVEINSGSLSSSARSTSSAPSGGGGGGSRSPPAICVGSSQNFGFAALQLSNIEAQVELSVDIYKNWRVTNVTLAMAPSHTTKAQQAEHADLDQQQQQQQHHSHGSGSIKDFTFETLDGDELNWRYLHMYENWTRNRLHVNFLDQFRRFVWVSLQRCLSESSEKLPVKLIDLFGHHKYN